MKSKLMLSLLLALTLLLAACEPEDDPLAPAPTLKIVPGSPSDPGCAIFGRCSK